MCSKKESLDNTFNNYFNSQKIILKHFEIPEKEFKRRFNSFDHIKDYRKYYWSLCSGWIDRDDIKISLPHNLKDLASDKNNKISIEGFIIILNESPFEENSFQEDYVFTGEEYTSFYYTEEFSLIPIFCDENKDFFGIFDNSKLITVPVRM